jgi:hypothetical protein
MTQANQTNRRPTEPHTAIAESNGHVIEELALLDVPTAEAIRKAWQDAIDAPVDAYAEVERRLRKMNGVTVPSSYIGSAEGFTVFQGLHSPSGNGCVNEAALAALSANGNGRIARANEVPEADPASG